MDEKVFAKKELLEKDYRKVFDDVAKEMGEESTAFYFTNELGYLCSDEIVLRDGTRIPAKDGKVDICVNLIVDAFDDSGEQEVVK